MTEEKQASGSWAGFIILRTVWFLTWFAIPFIAYNRTR